MLNLSRMVKAVHTFGEENQMDMWVGLEHGKLTIEARIEYEGLRYAKRGHPDESVLDQSKTTDVKEMLFICERLKHELIKEIS